MKTFAAAIIASTAFAGRYTSIEHPCRIQESVRGPPRVRQALEYLSDLPETWRWDNVNGTNYLTNVWN